MPVSILYKDDNFRIRNRVSITVTIPQVGSNLSIYPNCYYITLSDNTSRINMRVRYWRLNITEVLQAAYPSEKANHWDIKCMQGEYEHFGVFWYRYGTPFDKEPVHGICFYYNEIPQKRVDELASFLQSNFGGKLLSLHSRGFLQGSKEFADSKSIGMLGNELSLRFNAPVELTIEFEKVSKEEVDQESFKLPSSKALPITGTD